MNRTFRYAIIILALVTSLYGSRTANAQAFSNSTLINILDDATVFGDGSVQPADPYPSSIVVSGVASPITFMSVTLYGFWHGFMRDVDILLVGPTDNPAGVRSWSILTSDAGGGSPGISSTAPINLTFFDQAPNSLEFFAIPSSGVYKPTQFAGGEDPDGFPGTGPLVARPAALSTFSGTNANGTWRLYVVDDGSGSVGQIVNGWGIAFSTVVPEPGVLPLFLCGGLLSGGLIARRRSG